MKHDEPIVRVVVASILAGATGQLHAIEPIQQPGLMIQSVERRHELAQDGPHFEADVETTMVQGQEQAPPVAQMLPPRDGMEWDDGPVDDDWWWAVGIAVMQGKGNQAALRALLSDREPEPA